MKKKLALIDIDNTLNLFDATCVIVAHNLFGTKVSELYHKWNGVLRGIDDPDQRNAVFKESHSAKYMFLTGPLAGSVDGVKEISKDYDVMYLSDRSASAHDDTVDWLTLHGFPHPSKLVCSDDKRAWMKEHKDEIGIIVDDRPRTLVFAKTELKLENVFSIEYNFNRNLDDIEGVHLRETWDELMEVYRAVHK